MVFLPYHRGREREDARLRRYRELEKVKILDHGVDFQEPADFGELQLSYRTGDIVTQKITGVEPLWIEAQRFVERIRCAADGRLGRPTRVTSLEAVQTCLDSGGLETLLPLSRPASQSAVRATRGPRRRVTTALIPGSCVVPAASGLNGRN